MIYQHLLFVVAAAVVAAAVIDDSFDDSFVAAYLEKNFGHDHYK